MVPFSPLCIQKTKERDGQIGTENFVSYRGLWDEEEIWGFHSHLYIIYTSPFPIPKRNCNPEQNKCKYGEVADEY